MKKQHAEDRDEEYDIDDANGDPDNNDYDNDASMMLDYELGETSMNYLLDDEDEIDARLGPSKLMSGNTYNYIRVWIMFYTIIAMRIWLTCKYNRFAILLGGDAIAEPLYAFVGEVFDMRGVFKILRKVL